ncbi:hypothetical protein LT85_3852 [Collimonas arenae]|uniref:Uncharacterized protein n=1 Tax=Collimonas arenae TaxID=279058 RepID=A0A0A1FH59_9BURK|nr:hypothetical protein [Collimonas arenae]AIY43010.1 hypothetical protein LT85_3852 [Collimonas arenae]
MYPDIKRIRNNRIMVRMDHYELAIVESIANYQGEAVSTIVRQMVMKEAMAIMAEFDNDSVSRRVA